MSVNTHFGRILGEWAIKNNEIIDKQTRRNVIAQSKKMIERQKELGQLLIDVPIENLREDYVELYLAYVYTTRVISYEDWLGQFTKGVEKY